jgi:hypothetical protein
MKLNNGATADDPDNWTLAFRPDNTWTFIDKAKSPSVACPRPRKGVSPPLTP